MRDFLMLLNILARWYWLPDLIPKVTSSRVLQEFTRLGPSSRSNTPERVVARRHLSFGSLVKAQVVYIESQEVVPQPPEAG